MKGILARNPQVNPSEIEDIYWGCGQLVRLAASKLDKQSPDATAYCAMAKRFATDVGFNVCDQALQLYGGYGYIKEYPMVLELECDPF